MKFYNGQKIYNAGTTQLLINDVKEIYNKKFIVNYSGIFQAHYSDANNDFYFSKILNIKGLAQRGRYYTMTAKEINNLLGVDCLISFAVNA